MRNILILTRKELQSFFNSPIAYICIASFLMINNWLFFQDFFVIDQAGMRGFFSLIPWIFLFLMPAITMRMWAEERKSGSFEILVTLPVRSYELVMGKFLSCLLFMILIIALSVTVPLTIWEVGAPDPGPIIGGYLGIIFLGSSFLAIGLWVSCLAINQIVAFILGVSFSFMLMIIGEDLVISRVPAGLAPLFQILGLGRHFQSISRGVVDTRDVIYYLSVIGFFLYLNTRVINSRR
jgi:ABC-2 type transport system permease protein